MPEATPRYRQGTGEPLLLVHAAMLSWRLWEPVLPMLTGERDVLATTLPGHLGGPAFRRPLGNGTLTECVDYLEAELDAAGWDRPDVVGNSLGGWCAMELARRGRARRVVGIGAVGMQTAAQERRYERQFIGAQVLAKRTRWLSNVAFASPAVRRQSLAMVASGADRLPAALVRALVRAVAGCELTDLFKLPHPSDVVVAAAQPEKVALPVLLLWGNADKLVGRDQVDRYLAALPDVRLVELEGLGHCPQLDDPDRVAKEIREFLRP